MSHVPLLSTSACLTPACREGAVIWASLSQCKGHGRPSGPRLQARGGHTSGGLPLAGVRLPPTVRQGWGGAAVRVPTWFLACLYRVCFKASESKVALSTSLTSNAASAALRRSSPFPKVGIGCKANRPPGGSSVHLHQRPRGPALARLPAAASRCPTAGSVPACTPRRCHEPHAQGDTHTDTRTPDRWHMNAGN